MDLSIAKAHSCRIVRMRVWSRAIKFRGDVKVNVVCYFVYCVVLYAVQAMRVKESKTARVHLALPLSTTSNLASH
jgi:hypothetical protein